MSTFLMRELIDSSTTGMHVHCIYRADVNYTVDIQVDLPNGGSVVVVKSGPGGCHLRLVMTPHKRVLCMRTAKG